MSGFKPGPAQGMAEGQSAAEPSADIDNATAKALRQRNIEVMNYRISSEEREAAALRTKLRWRAARISAAGVDAPGDSRNGKQGGTQ